MRKKIIFLFDAPFTEFSSFRMETKILKKKKINFELHDLSYLIAGKKYASEWKMKIDKKTIKFFSLILWIKYFNRKCNNNTIIWTDIKTYNFHSFIIELVLRLSKMTIIYPYFYDIFSKPLKKKSFDFIAKRIIYHQFRLGPYIYFFKNKIFNFLISFFKYKNILFLSNNSKEIKYTNVHYKKKTNIDFNSYDYSNFYTYKNKKNIKKKYAIYLDSGGPYIGGDVLLAGGRRDEADLEKYYKTLNSFFQRIEKYFNIRILIIPHPKYKSYRFKKKNSRNPFFDKKKVVNDYDALPKLALDSLFFINHLSTAQSYAIIAKKPIIYIHSSKYIKLHISNDLFFKQITKKIGQKPIDICNFTMREVKKSLKVDLKKYESYKYNYLTPRNKSIENKTNSEILANIVERF